MINVSRFNYTFKYLILAALFIGSTFYEEAGASDFGTKVIEKQEADEDAVELEETYPAVSGKGILWKPFSESDHNLVILLNTSYGNPGVTVLDGKLEVIESGRYVGHTNGNRATYRFGRNGAGFPDPCLLEVSGNIYYVQSPFRRHEPNS